VSGGWVYFCIIIGGGGGGGGGGGSGASAPSSRAEGAVNWATKCTVN